MHLANLRLRVEADRHGAARSYGVGSGGCGQNRGVGGDLPHVGGASGVWRGRCMGCTGRGIACVVAGRGVGGKSEAGIPISPEGLVRLLRKRPWGRRRGVGVNLGGDGGVDGAAGRERGGLAERGGWRDDVLEIAVCRLGPSLDAF